MNMVLELKISGSPLRTRDDADVNGEEVDTLWYYFGDNGKAYKAGVPLI